MLNKLNLKSLSFLYVVLLLLLLTVINSCEPDEDLQFDPTSSQPLDLNSIVQDSTYTDEELRALLTEEDSIKVLIAAGKIMDISGMTVAKDNPKKVYVHYMPWYQSKDYDGYWGQHWTMANQNPDLINSDGLREIASYYYPIIGPYSSIDPDLQEYHMIMMKLAGIDGVIFDWYGSKDVYDYQLIKQATESFMTRLVDLDLDFSIMYEDRVAQNSVDFGMFTSITEAAKSDFEYIQANYLNKANYLSYDNRKLMFVFGPGSITEPAQWDEIFSVFPEAEKPHFVTLWAANQNVGANASGEFLWVAPDHLLAHQYYYDTYLNTDFVTVGSSYPGFESFYNQGGWGLQHDWQIFPNNGNTFVETLNYTHHEDADFIQLVTWNDFGEGTMIEPTEEFGFFNLQILQQYTGVSYTPDHLTTALDLYKARKLFAKNSEAQYYLDRSYQYIKQSRLDRAKKVIAAVYRRFS